MAEQVASSESAYTESPIVIDSTPSSDFLSEETHWERAARTRMGRYLTQVEADFITDCVKLAENDLILDIGAEAGRFSIWAVKKNLRVVSLDIDSYVLKRLNSRNENVDVILADARHIPFRDRVFDAVFMIQVLDYVPELDITLGDCSRSLKKDGSIVLTFGNRLSLKSRLKKLHGKPYLHSYRNVTQSLARLGKILRTSGYNWLPFGRTSENSLIPSLANVERVLRLRKFHMISPWVIVHAIVTK